MFPHWPLRPVCQGPWTGLAQLQECCKRPLLAHGSSVGICRAGAGNAPIPVGRWGHGVRSTHLNGWYLDMWRHRYVMVCVCANVIGHPKWIAWFKTPKLNLQFRWLLNVATPKIHLRQFTKQLPLGGYVPTIPPRIWRVCPLVTWDNSLHRFPGFPWISGISWRSMFQWRVSPLYISIYLHISHISHYTSIFSWFILMKSPISIVWFALEDATPDLLNVCWDASTYDSKGNVTAHVATPLEELPLVGVNVLMGVSPFGLRGALGVLGNWKTFFSLVFLLGGELKTDFCVVCGGNWHFFVWQWMIWMAQGHFFDGWW